MSCNKCKSSPCACSDHGLTIPCSYTDCTDPTVETCEELHYMKCVSYSGNTFHVFDGAGVIIFSIENGERLDIILQRMIKMHYDAACVIPGQDHAVLHLWTTAKTANSVTIAWGDVADGYTTGFNIYYRQYVSDVPVADLVSSLDGGTLVAGTGYFNLTGVPTTGGTGTGLTVDIVTSGGSVTTVTINNPGSEYTSTDIITIAQVGSGLDATIVVNGITQWIQATPPGWPTPPPFPPALPASTILYDVTELLPNTKYGFYIEAVGAVTDCDSLEIIETTLP